VCLWDCKTGQVAEASLNCILPRTPSSLWLFSVPLFFYVPDDKFWEIGNLWRRPPIAQAAQACPVFYGRGPNICTNSTLWSVYLTLKYNAHIFWSYVELSILQIQVVLYICYFRVLFDRFWELASSFCKHEGLKYFRALCALPSCISCQYHYFKSSFLYDHKKVLQLS
jgi:hypothetical protein